MSYAMKSPCTVMTFVFMVVLLLLSWGCDGLSITKRMWPHVLAKLKWKKWQLWADVKGWAGLPDQSETSITAHMLFTDFNWARRLAWDFVATVDDVTANMNGIKEQVEDNFYPWLTWSGFGNARGANQPSWGSSWAFWIDGPGSWVNSPVKRAIVRRGVAQDLTTQEWGYFCALVRALDMASWAKWQALLGNEEKAKQWNPYGYTVIDILENWTDAVNNLAKGVELGRPLLYLDEALRFSRQPGMQRSQTSQDRLEFKIYSQRVNRADDRSLNDSSLDDQERKMILDLRVHRDEVLFNDAAHYSVHRNDFIRPDIWAFDERNTKVKIDYEESGLARFRFVARGGSTGDKDSWISVKENNFDVLMAEVRDCEMLVGELRGHAPAPVAITMPTPRPSRWNALRSGSSRGRSWNGRSGSPSTNSNSNSLRSRSASPSPTYVI